MCNDQSTLTDIESGSGLKPISPQTDNATNTSGLTSENRGQSINGLRSDSFTLIQTKKKTDE